MYSRAQNNRCNVDMRPVLQASNKRSYSASHYLPLSTRVSPLSRGASPSYARYRGLPVHAKNNTVAELI